ncbi:MAG: hypothetical protein KJP19_03895 [Deltaproteobacteria bacterium]|nr:hypothetical protein [Deltaproteobacteria bacterium]
MSSENRRKYWAIFFVLVTLAIPFVMIYYVSTDTYKDRYREWRKRSDEINRTVRSSVNADQVVLAKDEKLKVGRTYLEFKGFEKKTIFLNLYLIDLDSLQAYPKTFLKKEAKRGITLGGNKYKLLAVNKRFLSLKLLNSTQSP